MLKSLAIFSLVLLMSLVHGHPSLFPNGTFNDDDALKFFFKRGDPDVLPSHYWRRAKHQEDIDAFQARYNLTLVSAQPQDAALLPSWPQALLQYLLINPIINLSCSSSTTRTYNGQVMYHEHTELGIWDVLQYIVLLPCFIAWIISFGRIQSVEKATAGWVSTMGWGSWVCFASDAPGVLTIPSLVLALFQWSASLAVIIQRWTKDIGTVAYRITDLNSCAPSDGLDFLQNSPYDRAYRIIQTTTFCVSTVFMLLGGGSKDAVNSGISVVGLAELIYSSVMATRGMPLVVSGNCLLVQLNPRLGYLDSSISTTWKALSGFMGF